MKKPSSFFSAGTEEYPALTGIRACGAIVVFFDHFPLTVGAHPVINVMAFFYVLSGFLIVRLYYDKLRLNLHWFSGYFLRRFSRIYPVYFLLLTIAFLLSPEYRPVLLHPSSNPLLLIKNYTLTHALFHWQPDIVINPSWSLTVEECFYLFAPGFILLIRRFNFFVSLLSGVLLLLIALYISNTGVLFLQTPIFVFSVTFFGHFFEFFSGIGLAVIIMRLEKKGIPKKKGLWWTLAGSAGILVLNFVMLSIYSHPPPLDVNAIIVVGNFLLPLPIALLYFGLIRENSFFGKVLSGKLFRILGRSSYSFYLLHTLVITYISIPLLPPLFGGHRVLAVLLTLIGTWLLSIGLFLFYEEPLNLWIRSSFLPKKKMTTA
jgi:peptidoglycan/LPS O-acetylase OafA/YrhL